MKNSVEPTNPESTIWRELGYPSHDLVCRLDVQEGSRVEPVRCDVADEQEKHLRSPPARKKLMPLGLEMSDAKVYGPEIRACHGSFDSQKEINPRRVRLRLLYHSTVGSWSF